MVAFIGEQMAIPLSKTDPQSIHSILESLQTPRYYISRYTPMMRTTAKSPAMLNEVRLKQNKLPLLLTLTITDTQIIRTATKIPSKNKFAEF